MFFPLYATVLIFFSTAAESSPEIHLTADPPWTVMFPGEKVTLTCQVIGSQGWTFLWIRRSRSGASTQIRGSGTDHSVLVLDSAAERHSGQYHCEAVKLNERVVSNVHSITVSAVRPQAVIVTDPVASQVFAGESVSLACIIEGSGWRYSWSRVTQQRLQSLSARSTESQQRHSIDSVRESDGGTFLCNGERGQNPVIQSLPGSLVLNVSGEKPKPMVTQNPLTDTLNKGERVTLSCGFGGDSASWEYLWYRDTMDAALPNTDRSGVSYTIRSAALDHSGEYRCRAARGTKPFYSEYSDPLTLHISGLPRAHLSVQSGWTEVFSTETVTLKCVIEDSSTDWMYKWYREGEELRVDQAETGDTYTILSAEQSHTVSYSCRGELKRRAVQSTVSNAVKLNILPVPKANLTVLTGWTEIFPSETVTLKCFIEDISADWIYKWYRGGEKLAVEETDFSSETGDTFTILSAEQSHSGQYRCRGELTMRPTVHSMDSSSVTLSVQAQLQAVLALNVGWVEIFTIITQGSLTMRCELQGSSADWNYIWYRNRTKISLNNTGQIHTVGFWDSFSHEEYACQGNRTDGRHCSVISEGFTPASIRPYVILGLSGCVIIFITMVVLAVKCCEKPKIAGENQVDVGKFYSRVNEGYVSRGHGLLNQAVYEKIDPTSETEGSEVAASQLSFYSAVLFKPLNQGEVSTE